MKKVTKSITLILTLGMSLLLAAWDDNSEGKSFYEQGLELISLMEEMAESENYVALYTSESEVQELVSAVGSGDYAEPKAVYQIRISEDMISEMVGEAGIDELSDTLKEYVISSTQMAVSNLINTEGGVDALTAAVICTAGKTFVSEELQEDVIYLYTYENAVPAIVTFTVGEDGAVSATSRFIFYEDFKTDTAQDIEQFFTEMTVEVEELEKD